VIKVDAQVRRCPMLDAYIIERIRKRHEEQEGIYERPALERPLPPPPGYDSEAEPEERPRVIIIDL